MKLKQDYFIKNSNDLDKSVAKYLDDARMNFVIYNNNIVGMDSKGVPTIYGSVDEAFAAVHDMVENGGWKMDEVAISTELDFIREYCLDAIKEYIGFLILTNKGKIFDSVNWVVHPNPIEIEEFDSDIIGIYFNENSNQVFLFISNEDDSEQIFLTIEDTEIENNTFIAIFYTLEED